MNERDLKEFEKHIGEGITVDIVNAKGETSQFTFEPLTGKYLGKFAWVSSKLPRPKDGESADEFTSRLQKSDFDVYGDLVELIEAMIKQSYPDIPEKVLSRFVFKNMNFLTQILVELNSDINPDAKEASDVKAFLEKRRTNASSQASIPK